MAKKYIATKDQLDLVQDDVTQLLNAYQSSGVMTQAQADARYVKKGDPITLTDQQKAELKGEKGEKGDQGIQGPKGEKGDPLEFIDLTDIQKAELKGEPGAPGTPGTNGIDGVSPMITTSKTGKVTTISITDKSGTKTTTVSDGEDGVSPTVTTSKTGKTTTITITDKSGVKTAIINDGEDGISGSSGTVDTSNLVPRKISPIADGDKNVSSGSILEKSSGIETATVNSNNFTIRNCRMSGDLDLSGTVTHGIFEDIHIWNPNARFLINKETGWFGSVRFRDIFANGCTYPFEIVTNDCTDLLLDGITIENSRVGIKTNTQFVLSNSYIGDNNLETDSAVPDCAILAKSKTDIVINDCELSCGVRTGQNNPVIRFDATEDSPAKVVVNGGKLLSNNQNKTNGGYGGVAELSNKNDRLFLNNVGFDPYPARVNNLHCVAPYVLKPYQTVWSETPFYNYLCHGDDLNPAKVAPRSDKIAVRTTDLLNPFGGKIIDYEAYGFIAYYSIPERLVGQKMYLHVYCAELLSGSNKPSINYDGSDCSESGYSNNFTDGTHPMVTPYLNVIEFTPNKEKGKINFYVGNGGKVTLAGAFLVEAHHKWRLCCYETWDKSVYSHNTPKCSGVFGDFVYSIDPVSTSNLGWRHDGTNWTIVNS